MSTDSHGAVGLLSRTYNSDLRIHLNGTAAKFFGDVFSLFWLNLKAALQKYDYIVLWIERSRKFKHLISIVLQWLDR